MHPATYEALGYPAVRLLTIAEACDRLGCSRSHFYDAVVKHVPIRKVGSASRVRSDDLDAYIFGLPPSGTDGAR